MNKLATAKWAQILGMLVEGMSMRAVTRSPSECIGTRKRIMRGNPAPEKISTSYVERSNLSVRMGVRRLPRLTNAFSKRLLHHAAALSL